MSSKIRTVITAILLIAQSQVTPAQAQIEHSVFWEVSGNGLAKPSYLFGTFHLVGRSHIDTLTNVLDKFNGSTLLVGEVAMDTAALQKAMTAALLKGTTLDQVLGKDLYERTAALFKELTGGADLKLLNGVTPITVQVYLMTLMQQKYLPASGTGAEAMDQYFQQIARRQGKDFVPLETIDDQIHILFDQFSYARQAELLAIYVNDKDKFYEQMVEMNRHYFSGDLTGLESMMEWEHYSSAELEMLLFNRNRNWMRQLPALFQRQSVFVAVGAMHLASNLGLIALLRQQGYQVRPLPLR